MPGQFLLREMRRCGLELYECIMVAIGNHKAHGGGILSFARLGRGFPFIQCHRIQRPSVRHVEATNNVQVTLKTDFLSRPGTMSSTWVHALRVVRMDVW